MGRTMGRRSRPIVPTSQRPNVPTHAHVPARVRVRAHGSARARARALHSFIGTLGQWDIDIEARKREVTMRTINDQSFVGNKGAKAINAKAITILRQREYGYPGLSSATE